MGNFYIELTQVILQSRDLDLDDLHLWLELPHPEDASMTCSIVMASNIRSPRGYHYIGMYTGDQQEVVEFFGL